MPSIVEGVLLAALVGTSACVVPMYLKLKRLDRVQAEYGRAVAASGEALASAGEAVRGFAGEGREVLEALSLKIGEARAALADLEACRRDILARAASADGASLASATRARTMGLHRDDTGLRTTSHG